VAVVLRQFAHWLAATAPSRLLQDHQWIVPTSQSLHIIGISLVFASATAVNLRLVGVAFRRRGVLQVIDALVPWMWRGLALLLVTGVLQTLTEPVRELVTPVYWAKMGMIAAVALLTRGYVGAVRRRADASGADAARPAAALPFAVVSTLLWLAVIACGRFIAYTSMYFT
jgi:hypothetical protein